MVQEWYKLCLFSFILSIRFHPLHFHIWVSHCAHCSQPLFKSNCWQEMKKKVYLIFVFYYEFFRSVERSSWPNNYITSRTNMGKGRLRNYFSIFISYFMHTVRRSLNSKNIFLFKSWMICELWLVTVAIPISFSM